MSHQSQRPDIHPNSDLRMGSRALYGLSVEQKTPRDFAKGNQLVGHSLVGVASQLICLLAYLIANSSTSIGQYNKVPLFPLDLRVRSIYPSFISSFRLVLELDCKLPVRRDYVDVHVHTSMPSRYACRQQTRRSFWQRAVRSCAHCGRTSARDRS